MDATKTNNNLIKGALLAGSESLGDWHLHNANTEDLILAKKIGWYLASTSSPADTFLFFYLKEGLLTGVSNGKLVNLKAFSGGGGGHKPIPNKTPAMERNYLEALKKENIIYEDTAVNSVDSTSRSEILKYKYVGIGNAKKRVEDGYIQRGGSIPCGRYAISKLEPHFNGKSMLPSLKATALWDRNVNDLKYRTGLLIHARGKKGSDGCIVVEDFLKLQALLKDIDATKGGTLEVYEDSNEVKHEFNMKGDILLSKAFSTYA